MSLERDLAYHEDREEYLRELDRLDGIFVGLLTDEERLLFDQAVERHDARRSYEGGAGFFGLAKVRGKP